MEQMTAMRALNVEPTSVDRPPDRDAQTSSRSSSPLRVFVGGLAHETNTFSPLPTSRRSFAEGVFHRGGDDATIATAMAFPGYGDMLEVCAQAGDQAVAGMCAWAQPGGPLPHREYERLREELFQEIERAGPLDFIVLVLHGAMVSSECWDCEGDLLNRLRDRVGGTPVGVLLDLHCNLTDSMLRSGALLVACKEYPHTDFRDRAQELRDLLADVVYGGRTMPRPAMRPVPMLALMGTTEDPMKEFVVQLKQCENTPGIASVSAMHGFAWSDTPHSRAALLAWYDPLIETAEERARSTVAALASRLYEIGTKTQGTRLPLRDAVARALSLVDGAKGRPVVFADGSDNPGGGAASDSTFVLSELLRQGVSGVALGMMWDPQAAAIAADAGLGAKLPLRIGGKVGPLSGEPVDLDVEVVCVRDDAAQRGLSGGREALGLAVTVRTPAIDIIINSIRQQVFSPDCFTEMGVDLSKKTLIVVKSTQHFRMGFDAVASAIVYCDAPGSLHGDLGKLPFRHLSRPIWPLDPARDP
jgi:microcystin degradation protein MlrC